MKHRLPRKLKKEVKRFHYACLCGATNTYHTANDSVMDVYKNLYIDFRPNNRHLIKANYKKFHALSTEKKSNIDDFAKLVYFVPKTYRIIFYHNSFGTLSEPTDNYGN